MSIGSQAFRTVVQALRSRTSVLVNPRKEIVDVFGEKLSQEVCCGSLRCWLVVLWALPVLSLTFFVSIVCLMTFFCVQISQIKLVLPGSFNPLHKGHIGVLEEAAALQRLPRDTSIEDGLAVFEISMHNADKGVIDEEELRLRLRGFYDIGASVVITAEHPTFVSKAKVRQISTVLTASCVVRDFPVHPDASSFCFVYYCHFFFKLLPGRSFVVGYDTAVRIVNPQYYEGQDPQHMVAALQDIYNSGGFVRQLGFFMQWVTLAGPMNDQSSLVPN